MSAFSKERYNEALNNLASEIVSVIDDHATSQTDAESLAEQLTNAARPVLLTVVNDRIKDRYK